MAAVSPRSRRWTVAIVVVATGVSRGRGGGGGGGPHQLRQRAPQIIAAAVRCRRAGPPSAPVTAWGALAQRLHPRLACRPGVNASSIQLVVAVDVVVSYLRYVVSFSDRGTSSC